MRPLDLGPSACPSPSRPPGPRVAERSEPAAEPRGDRVHGELGTGSGRSGRRDGRAYSSALPSLRTAVHVGPRSSTREAVIMAPARAMCSALSAAFSGMKFAPGMS